MSSFTRVVQNCFVSTANEDAHHMNDEHKNERLSCCHKCDVQSTKHFKKTLRNLRNSLLVSSTHNRSKSKFELSHRLSQSHHSSNETKNGNRPHKSFQQCVSTFGTSLVIFSCGLQHFIDVPDTTNISHTSQSNNNSIEVHKTS